MISKRVLLYFLVLVFFITPVNAWLDDWGYRMPLRITTDFGETDYQVELSLELSEEYDSGKVQEDCSDLRFTDSVDNKFNYWIEECNVNGISKVWVRVNDLSDEAYNLIYMYYGNSEVTSESNGYETFAYFDDFEDDDKCPKVFDTSSLAVWNQHESNPIIEPSGNGLDGKSIRGFAPMIDEDGYMVVENGHYVGYYMAFSYEASECRIFRTTSNNLSRTDWNAGELVLDQGEYGEWDSKTVATGNVIKLNDGSYVMDYVGKDNSDFYGIGIATSSDGITWEKYSGNPVMTEDDFYGPLNNTLISVSIPYMIKLSDGRYVMGIEGIDPVVQSPYQYAVYLAISDDGFNWEPMNGGYSVLLPVDETWENTHTANPKLIEISPGEYLMGYNAANSQWQLFLAFAYSNDLINWERYGMNPILAGVYPYNDRRLEDPVIVKDDLGTNSIGMYYFGCDDYCHAQGSKTDAVIEYATSNQLIPCSTTKDSRRRLIKTETEEISSSIAKSNHFSWMPSYKEGGHVSGFVNILPNEYRIDFSAYFIEPSMSTFSALGISLDERAAIKFSQNGVQKEILVKNFETSNWEGTGFYYGLHEWEEIGIYQDSQSTFSLYFNDQELSDLDMSNSFSDGFGYLNFNARSDEWRDFFVDNIRVRKFNEGAVSIQYGEEQRENIAQPSLTSKTRSLTRTSFMTGFLSLGGIVLNRLNFFRK